MLNHWLTLWFTFVGEALLAYLLILNSLYLAFAIISFFELQRHRRRWTARDLDVIVRSPATPPISLIVPAYNEAATIGESLRALLLLNYPEYEVVVVNDGSTDDTLQAAIEAFGLVHADAANERILATQPVRGVYRSLMHRELLMIDKANGGKADAINAGVNAAKHPLVCVIDADSLLEEHALTRAVLPFLEDPTTIAAGGIIRIANGCRVQDGRVTHVGLPSSVAGHLPDYRVPAGLPGRTRRAVGAEQPADHLGGVRRVPPRRAALGRRLPDRHRRRGHGGRGPAASQLPGARREVPDRLPSGPGVLDRGPGGTCPRWPASAIAGTAARCRRCTAIAACCSTRTTERSAYWPRPSS